MSEFENLLNKLLEQKSELSRSDIEEMIQNTNKLWKNTFGKGFLKKSKKGSNAIKEAGIALKNKLLQYEKIKEVQ